MKGILLQHVDILYGKDMPYQRDITKQKWLEAVTVFVKKADKRVLVCLLKGWYTIIALYTDG